SSRDWAAKGPNLLGVRAAIADSYERIHRSNLLMMGIAPLQFMPGENAESLGLTGREEFSISGLEGGEAEEGTVRADDQQFRARRRGGGSCGRGAILQSVLGPLRGGGWTGPAPPGEMDEFVPPEFEVPRGIETSAFVLEPLGPEHNDRDYDAWTSSLEHIAAT